MAKTIDITTLTGFSSLAVGTHAISVVAKGTGKIDSVKSNTINYSIYSITGTGSNCTIQEGSGTATANYSGKCGQSQTKVLNISCTSSFVLPSSMTITGAVYARQTTTTATVTITTPSANVNFSITATALRTVSATATNATVNGNTTYSGTVLNGGTLTLSLGANGTSHKLPTSITVAETTVNAGSSTVISNKCTVLFTRTSDTAGTIAFSNVTDDVTFSVVGEPATQPMPVKGQIINLNLDGTTRQYRVLKVNGTQVEVLAMFTPGDVVFNSSASCFLEGTKITLSDGTTKNVEDITYNDELLVWDFDEGRLGAAKVCWLTKTGLTNDHYYKLTFSDGTELYTTGENSNHKVYNVDEHFFKGVNKTEIGDRIYSEKGIVTVTAKEYIDNVDVPYYNLMTSKKINCFANGILTSDRYGNMYEIDENMKYIKEERPYREYSEFEAVGISEYWYEHLRLHEQKDSMLTILNYIVKCESQMRDIDIILGKTGESKEGGNE